ncbi:MAG: 2-keto-myo-inositol dehydratase [Planctomycetaceae bacterium]|nr:2-keto-myo-inositol dehydratase [Planctomycetaceae bacterium]MBP63383.1 2-keto-myo-inositol dehydratase [Planctomycetaceae bacterium]
MKITLGTAPDAWGVWFPEDSRQIPWRRFLDEVAETGYEWIELGPYGYLPTQLSVLRDELGSRGLKVCACVVEGNLEEASHWEGVEAQVRGGGELAAGLGGEFLVLIDDSYTDLVTGKLTAPARLDGDTWKRLIDTVHRVAEMARDRFGLKLVFHPNAETHVETEDQIETLLAQTEVELVSLCLDIGHHAYSGGDAVEFIRRHYQRIIHIHFKNIDAEVMRRVEAEGIHVGRAAALDAFCGPEEGAVDYEAVRDVLQEVNYSGFAIVEQDMFPAPFDKPLPIARRSVAYLKKIGLA